MQDKDSPSDLNVEVIYPPQAISTPGVSPPPMQSNNGYAVVPLGTVVPSQPQTVAQSAGVIVLAVGGKKGDDKAKKGPEISSVFKRL